MGKPSVFVSRLIPEKALQIIYKSCDADVWQGELPPPREVLLEKAREVEGMLTLLTDKIDKELLDQAPKLRVVSNMAVGYDNIDVPEATRHGVLVGNTPGVLTETTADFAFALLMAAARRVVEGDKMTREGLWKTWGPMVLLGQDIYDRTLGLVGLGRIGWEMAKRGMGFGMKIMYYDTQRREDLEQKHGLVFADLDTVLRESDFISIHTPLTPDTYHLIGAREFGLMKSSCVFVNTSRGPTVDQMALYEALKSEQIFAAGIDVTEVEPISMDDPLLTLDNIVICPHIASASVATRTKMAVLAAENLVKGLLGGQPPHPVNAEVLEGRGK